LQHARPRREGASAAEILETSEKRSARELGKRMRE